ncbi:MAG: GH3 auxin-responsive promoter family protein [Gammaproteobacteria bacterium]|nr:GH3 auxin-responsive promoter family protein [Gammaproteobacteria bacterium]
MSDPWRTLRNLQTGKAAAIDLARRQTDWLLACLQRNAQTLFGRRHGFDHIDSIQAYQDQVPLSDYAAFTPYIEMCAEGEQDILFEGIPRAFEQTGGSSGGGKLIAYSAASLADFGKALLPWLGDLVAAHELTRGSVYLSTSPATRQPTMTEGGIPIGLPDGAYLGPVAGQALQRLSAVPVWVSEITDVETWQLVTLYWLLRRQDLALISVWSPSFFLQLLQALSQRQAELESLLNNGGAIAERKLPADHNALDRFACYRRNRDSRLLWPELKLVSCWMDGSSRSLGEQLEKALPQARFQAKGLLATEGITTVPDPTGQPLLAAESAFHEFLDCQGQVCCAWELEHRQDYEVVLTTAGGLYRYRTGDLVRYQGLSADLPILSFIGRNDLGSDLVGEKLTEAFVAQCLEGIPGFRMLAAASTPRAHYTVITPGDNAQRVVSRLAELEARLHANPQYAYARKLGQLGALTVTAHPDPLRTYTTQAARQQRLGDVKVPALLPPTMQIDLFLENAS